MIKRRTIHILDVISILLFSILASYIFELDLDFQLPIDWIVILQLGLLTVSTFFFYFAVDKIKKIAAQSEKEYYEEKDPKRKESLSIDDRFSGYYNNEKLRINTIFIISVVFIVLYFIIKPTAKYFNIS